MSTLHRIGRVQIRMFHDHNPPHFHIWTPDGDMQVTQEPIPEMPSELKQIIEDHK